MSTLYAQPYNLDAVGFYFDSLESFNSQSENLTDRYGQPVEEFEIQFIDGDDAELFEACGINQGNLDVWFDEVQDLDEHEKAALYCLCGEIHYRLDVALQRLDDVMLSKASLKEAAEEMFDELYLPDVPESVRFYIDYDKFARDCEISGDMAEFQFNGNTWTCLNACSV